MQRGLVIFNKFVGPVSAATRGYASAPFLQVVSNTLKCANHFLTGRKPHFPVGDLSRYTTPMAKEAETSRQINAYLQNCASLRDLAKKTADAAAEDAGSKALAAVGTVIATLATAIMTADKDLDDLEASAKKEHADIMKDIKAAKLEADKESAAVKDLDTQYVSWMDWLNDSTNREKLKCKAAMSRALEAERASREELKAKEAELKAVEAARALRAKERETFLLLVN